MATVFIGAFAFETVFDTATDAVWDRVNAGRQWKDIRGKYIQAADASSDDSE
ncbi:hypothetical protein HDV00_004659 [Rhizophlyctis rosea]|nr:hypothetical protein HDV00_004659 [Rhizophlyctis rosea]